jgi:UDP-N-acetylglucosamine 2-epimerase (non-hydrolysing)
LKKVISVVGARPNFIKIAPIHKAFSNKKINHLICHTGQHFDEKMSKVFFDDLELPKPHFYLGVGSGSHAEQTARIMIEFEKILIVEQPDLIIVVGDVNSTLACSLVASKLQIKIAHVEAGLRSFDRKMPEEINRILTDNLADYLFVTEKSGIDNLINEGIDNNKVFFTGNVMIDSLIFYLPKINNSKILKTLTLEKNNYVLTTFHRPSNVDFEFNLKKIVVLLNKIANDIKIVFPLHPRTKNNLIKLNLEKELSANILLTEPLGYIDFMELNKNSKLIITDSGGIQEESTYLGVQCITVRDNTERPVTITAGTNQLAGVDFDKVYNISNNILNGKIKTGSIPELWDGNAAKRITQILLDNL